MCDGLFIIIPSIHHHQTQQDPLQEVTVTMLQQLYEQLAARYTTRPHVSGLTVVDNLGATTTPSPDTAPSSGWWSRFTRALNGGGGVGDEAGRGGYGGRPPIPRGLYMFGGVGCGKTMLMDLLVESVPREFKVWVGCGGGGM